MNQESDILIYNAPRNRNLSRGLTNPDDQNKQEILASILKLRKVDPKSHPTVVEFGAGLGGGAKYLIDLGWEANNITCLDIAQPDPGETLAVGANWKHVNLELFGQWLLAGKEITLPDLTALHHQFDLGISFNTEIAVTLELAVFKYCIKPNGYIITAPLFSPPIIKQLR